jgi:preprotein translocase subunit SecG
VQLAFQIGLIIVSILLIIIVLLHKGRGGGMSDMFGGGVSSSVGGSSVAERNLNRITVVLAVLWVALVVALGLNLN